MRKGGGREREKEREKETDRERERQRETKRERERERESEKPAEREQTQNVWALGDSWASKDKRRVKEGCIHMRAASRWRLAA